MFAGIHREDVKASIRKKHGSISAFEAVNGLPMKSVNRLFNGGVSKRVRDAIEQHLRSEGLLKGEKSPNPSAENTHRINQEAA